MNKLTMSERKVSSQQGEDGVLEEIAMRVFKGNLSDKHIFEFGAEHGLEGISRYFIQEYGWSATLIEVEPLPFHILRQIYSDNEAVTTLNIKVSTDNVQELVSKKPVDVLSIDIDGQDYWVWEAVTEKPPIVVIEYNADLRGRKVIIRGRDLPWDGTTAYGASIEAYKFLASKKGYTLVHTESCGVNAFFVRNDFVHLFPESDSPQIVTKNYRNFTATTDDVFVEV